MSIGTAFSLHDCVVLFLLAVAAALRPENSLEFRKDGKFVSRERGREENRLLASDVPGCEQGALSQEKNSEGEAVTQLQQALTDLGYDLGAGGADGDFGQATHDALSKFQEDEHIGVDGVYGCGTMRALRAAVNAQSDSRPTCTVRTYKSSGWYAEMASYCNDRDLVGEYATTDQHKHFKFDAYSHDEDDPTHYKIEGQCLRVMLIDEDGFADLSGKGNITVFGEVPCSALPYDLKQDLAGVKVWVGIPPKTASPRPGGSEAIDAVLTQVVEATSPDVARYSYRTTNRIKKVTALDHSVLFDLRTLKNTYVCTKTGGGSCVNRYMDLTPGYTITSTDLLGAGYSTSAVKVFRAVVQGESAGKGGAINNWDNQIVSWGLFQAAGKAGTLAKLLCHLKSLELSKDIYNSLFVANGIDVSVCSPGWKAALAITTPDGQVVEGNKEGAGEMQFNMAQLGTLMIAGQFKEMVVGQASYWRQAFLKPGINKKVNTDGKKRLCELVTSEWGIAVIARLYNWMPAWVEKWTNAFIKENPAFKSPTKWGTNMHEFIEYWNKKRKEKDRKEYVHGEYPQYAGEVLSKAPGSFNGGCM